MISAAGICQAPIDRLTSITARGDVYSPPASSRRKDLAVDPEDSLRLLDCKTPTPSPTAPARAAQTQVSVELVS